MIGQTISHYTILEKLGEGGMGVVCKAHGIKTNRIEPSPKGIDILTEGTALGLHLLSPVTTLKGLNT